MSGRDVAAEVERQIEELRAGVVEFYGEAELRPRLARAIEQGRPLRVKLGMDPSSPDLHLGHCVVLSKLRLFQELGHTPIFLVGDFTARIGDPSGRKKTRPALSEEEVKANAATYVEQAGKVLDVERAEVRFNSEWMQRMTPAELVVLCSKGTVARLLERDDFAKRYGAGEPISVHELLYPFVQAYDSVALEADVELGGTDQTFNLLMGREIQRDYGQPPQAVMTHRLLVGLDGAEKMSKSLGNAVGILDPPEEMYGRLMSISDSLMDDYYRLLDVGALELRSLGDALATESDPLARKQQLARAIVARFHGAQGARAGAEHFRRVVQRKEQPDEVPESALSLDGASDMGLLEILERVGLTSSRGEARRLVQQGGVSVDDARVEDAVARLAAGSYLLRVGKRRYLRLRLAP